MDNWVVLTVQDDAGNVGLYVHGDGHDICDLYTLRADDGEVVPFPDAATNANLIAAAPKLLEALQMMLHRFGHLAHDPGKVEAVEAATIAIAKARPEIAKEL